MRKTRTLFKQSKLRGQLIADSPSQTKPFPPGIEVQSRHIRVCEGAVWNVRQSTATPSTRDCYTQAFLWMISQSARELRKKPVDAHRC